MRTMAQPIHLTDSFLVKAPRDEVWPLLLDLEQVSGCLPGAEATRREDGDYDVRIGVRLGPISVRYQGLMRIVDADRDEYRAVLDARAKDDDNAQATARMSFVLSEQDGGTRADTTTDLELSGRIAQFGTGMVKDMSRFFMEEFVAEFSTLVASRRSGEPVEANQGNSPGLMRLFFRMLRAKFGRSRRRSNV